MLIAIRHWLSNDALRDELVDTNSETVQSLVVILRNPAFEQHRDEIIAILQHWKHP